jgi:hypothetical protein
MAVLRQAVLLLPLAAGCATRDLSESWVIDRLRILAVRPEPAEPRPGDTLTLSALVVSPDADLQAVVWLACLAGAVSVTGCEDDPDLIGMEPWLPPSYAIPEDILDGLDAEARLEGLNLWVQVSAVPEGAGSEADLELAFKRVPVSEAQTPNHNPEIIGLQVDGIDVEPGAAIELDRGEAYDIVPLLGDGSIEAYQYRTSSGVWEDRTEEPWFLWYVEEGELQTPWSVWPEPVQEWTTPSTPSSEDQTLWVVAADRRGGMAWWIQPVRVR